MNVNNEKANAAKDVSGLMAAYNLELLGEDAYGGILSTDEKGNAVLAKMLEHGSQHKRVATQLIAERKDLFGGFDAETLKGHLNNFYSNVVVKSGNHSALFAKMNEAKLKAKRLEMLAYDNEMVGQLKKFVKNHKHTNIMHHTETDDEGEIKLALWNNEVLHGRRIVSTEIEIALVKLHFDFRRPKLETDERRIETTAMIDYEEHLTVLLRDCGYLKGDETFEWMTMDVPMDANMPHIKKPDGMYYTILRNQLFFLKYEGEEHRHHSRTPHFEKEKNSLIYVAAFKLCEKMGKELGGIHFVHDNYAEVRVIQEAKLNKVCQVLKDSIVKPEKMVKITFIDFPSPPMFPLHKHVKGANDLLVSKDPFAKRPTEWEDCNKGWPLYDEVELVTSPDFWPGGKLWGRVDKFMAENNLKFSDGWKYGGHDSEEEEESEGGDGEE